MLKYNVCNLKKKLLLYLLLLYLKLFLFFLIHMLAEQMQLYRCANIFCNVKLTGETNLLKTPGLYVGKLSLVFIKSKFKHLAEYNFLALVLDLS